MRNYGDVCPVAAQAAGQGALALIRTCGEGSLECLSRVFSRPRTLLSAPGNTIVHGWILQAESKQKIDEVLVSVYRPPRSYTGEEGADISCHGGSAVVRAILETLRSAGFQDALPGEFTFRAFTNGKMDLTRSESVMELVSAKTGKALEQAVRRLSGSLEKEMHAIRDLVLETAAAVERLLDYPEDELFDTEEGLPRRAEAEAALCRLRLLSLRWRRDRLYREGALAVIAGRPNAGKSSLFNALLNEDRSIVTAAPGTTRDWIEGSLSLEGIPLRLADTAGLRELPGADPESAEAQGIRRSEAITTGADIIIYVVDGGEGPTEEDEAFLRDHDVPLVLVWNKSDLQKAPETPQKRFTSMPGRRFAELSAKTGSGLDLLCASILALLEESTGGDAASAGPGEAYASLGSRRQKEMTGEAAAALEEALSMADRNESMDLIAPLLREALHALGEITGETSSADILEKMFSRFCLGK